jgi:high-affinity iron transporter
MLVPFLIMLREGVEAALIVGIVASYLGQTGRRAAMRSVWIGVSLAAALCLTVGLVLDRLSAEFPQRIQELFEAAVGILAAAILASMVFWMRQAGGSIKASLHERVDDALLGDDPRGLALVAMSFFAVAREGLEAVFFLLAAFQQDVGAEAPVGALLGLAAAVLIGVGIYAGGVRLDLRRFFRWTGILILFVAAGLLSGAVRALHEAGLWNGLQQTAFDLSEVLPRDGVAGTLLSGLFGYNDSPAIGEVVVHLAFLIPLLILFLRPGAQPPRRRMSMAAVSRPSPALRRGAGVLALAAVVGLPDAARAQVPGQPVIVSVTAEACEPAALTVPAGTVTFLIVNKSSRALEWEILKGVMVVDERENIAPGFKQKMTTRLEPGEYEITCGLLGNPRGKLIVVDAAGGTVAAAARPSEIELIGPTAESRVWMVDETTALAERVRALAAAIAVGDLAQARSLWSDAHERYLRLAPALSLLPELDARIAGSKDLAAEPGGLRRIAHGLFAEGSTSGLEPAAGALSGDVDSLRARIRAASPLPGTMVAGTVAAVLAISAAAASGEAVGQSGTSTLGDADARLQGVAKIVELLRPLTARADRDASARIDASTAALRDELARHARDGGFARYASLTAADQASLRQAMGEFADRIAGLPAILGL